MYILETKTLQQAFQPHSPKFDSLRLRYILMILESVPEFLLNGNLALYGIHIHTTNMAFEIYLGGLLISMEINSGFSCGQRLVIQYFLQIITTCLAAENVSSSPHPLSS